MHSIGEMKFTTKVIALSRHGLQILFFDLNNNECTICVNIKPVESWLCLRIHGYCGHFSLILVSYSVVP